MFRAALLVMWLVAAALSWWSAPRQAGYDEARAAVAGKHLTEYRWGDSWDSDGPRRWFGNPTLRSAGTQGPIFAWRTDDGRIHWTDTDDLGDATLTGTVDEDGYSGPGAASIAQDLAAAGLEDRSGAVDAQPPWVTGAEALLILAFLAVVVTGPAPVLGTRWYWFWLTWTAPYGLGLMFWLFRDRPWSRTARPAGKSDTDSRDRGWLGLLTGILASFLLSVVVSVLNGLLGDQWVPDVGWLA